MSSLVITVTLATRLASIASALASSVLIFVVRVFTFEVILACNAVSSLVITVTLATRLASMAVCSVTLATRLASIASALASSVLIFVVRVFTFDVSLACKAVSSVVSKVTLAARLVSIASCKVTFATRLASMASAFASSTFKFAFNRVNVIKSLASANVFIDAIVTFLVESLLISTIGNTSLSAILTAASSVRSVIFTFAI